MAKKALCSVLAMVVVGATAIACGGTDGSTDNTFPGANAPANNSGTGNGSDNGGGSANNGGGSLGGTGGTGGGSTTTNNGGGTGVDMGSACATATLGATALPLHIVFLLDRSGSMCEYTPNTNPRDCTNASSKWVQATNAIKNFVGSPDSRGIKASMIVFPYVDNGQCDSSKYTTPIAPEVTLPDTTTLPPAIDAHVSKSGSTPTLNALTGTVEYAQSIVTQTGGKEKVVIVIATDGIPQGCSDDGTITPAANEAKTVAATIPTYVIGVGDQVGNLDSLASAGGTTKAFTASNSTPSQTGAQLASALNTIRGATMSCNFAIPAAPAGQTLDYTKINVSVTTKGTPNTIGYSQDCSDPNGWKYDDVNKPTQVELCSTQCDDVKADAFSSVNLILGCTTQKSGVN